MDQGLQNLITDQCLAIWTQQIAGCRSGETSVKSWRQENDVSERNCEKVCKKVKTKVFCDRINNVCLPLPRQNAERLFSPYCINLGGIRQSLFW